MKFAPILLIVAMTTTSRAAEGLKPGQYEIQSQNTSQQICLVSDGTWYGTSFDWSGHWSDTVAAHTKTEIYGNYAVNTQSPGYANDTLTVETINKVKSVQWYDWFDDFSYKHYEVAPLVFVKKLCDPAFTGQNTQAASQ
jgi:hypothetical protein